VGIEASACAHNRHCIALKRQIITLKFERTILTYLLSLFIGVMYSMLTFVYLSAGLM